MKTAPDTLYEVVKKSASDYPNHTAYDFLGYKASYKNFLDDIDACADYLVNIGVKPKDIVTIYLPNIPYALVLLYAVNKIGAIANFIHPEHPVDAHCQVLAAMNPRVIFLLDSFYKKVDALIEYGINPIFVLVRVSAYLPPHLKLFQLINETSHRLNIKTSENLYYYKKPKDTVHCAAVSQTPDQTALILFTGGTTGDSKGVCLSNKNVNICAAQTSTYKSPSEGGDSMLAILPIFHGFGLAVCIHTTIMDASKVILLPYYKDRLFLKTIIREKPNYILGVPRLYSRMTRLLNKTDIKLDFFKGLYCGGAVLSDIVRESFNELLKSRHSPVLIREGYGLTECVSACTLMPENDLRKGSVGKPYPGIIIKIRNPISKETLDFGEFGEICIQSETIMNGYFNEESANIGIEKSGRWLYTGDLGCLDEEGFLYFADRLKRMIKIAGYEVYPANIEKLIGSVSGITNCCVVEQQKKGLSYLKAYLVKNSQSDEVHILKSVKNVCNKKLPGYSIPGEFEFVDYIPETLMKKNDYKALS